VNQKRTCRRNKSQQQHDAQPTPSHRYPTRAATVAATNEAMEETKKEIEAIGKRIAEIEDRVGKMREEIAEGEEQIAKVLALGPRLEELAERLEIRWKAQDDVNASLIAEISKLKSSVAPAIERNLKRHAQELQDLSIKYQQLYSFAAYLFYVNQTAAPSNDFKSSYASYPTPVTTPDRAMITAF
jgi:chromosome segregation ATPase